MFRAEAADVHNLRSAGLEETTLSSQWGEHAKKQAKQVNVDFRPSNSMLFWDGTWDGIRWNLLVWANMLIPYSVGMQISIRGRWSHGSYPNLSYGNYTVI